ncbi:MAG: hypothetical protein A2W91_11605 [Bacteroidetes bacterium GWF2_38_335]|nr:MAG: hypothetical protein A2W91_11605 [Bacteroidetes bacterium GWF2_38_335]OFY77925.1 MAG: hypothetical protein A2281_18350 [Bacteroidetes bacterium RIFOXYA12_FULL_38_20]HBS86665.1 hypothetical protein [Bacteroidales bacterium]
MKKTFTINISGQIFHIDDDAYDRLQGYLNSVHRKFSNEEEGNEIISDIESRIAELFSEKITGSKQVITIEDVIAVIKIMGEPEEFEDSNKEDKKPDEPLESGKGKRVYRDPEDMIIGGVCGGFGAYFGLDPLIFRITFIVLTLLFGAGFWIYLILWAVVPKARTTAEKLEMKGERVNVSNIEKTIREEFSNVKSNIKNLKKNRKYGETRNFFENIFENLGDGFRTFAKTMVIFIGTGFVIFGLFMLLTFISSYFFEDSFFSYTSWSSHSHSIYTMFETVVSPANVTMIFLGLFFVIGIPLIAMVYGGIKMIFNLRTNNRMVGISFLAFWILGIIILVVVGISEGRNFRTKGKDITVHSLTGMSSDTLYVTMNNDGMEDDLLSIHENTLNLLQIDDEYVMMGRPQLSVVLSESKSYELIIKKRSRGRNKADANENSEEIIYNWNFEGSTLVLDNYFKLAADEKWRRQSMELILKVPYGKTVYFNKNVDDIMNEVSNTDNIIDEDMTGKMWRMGKEGLSLVPDTSRY